MNIEFAEQNTHLAERALLGSILLNDLAYATAKEYIETPDMFDAEIHQAIYLAIQQVYAKFGKVCHVALLENLWQGKHSTGIASYMASLIRDTPTSHNCELYAKMVFESHLLRQLAGGAEEVAALAVNGRATLDQLREKVATMAEAVMSRIDRERVESSEDLAAEAVLRLQELATGGGVVGLRTGIDEYDKLTTGLGPDMHIIAARPSVGKTALVMNIAYNLAVNQGKKVLFISLEMSKPQLMQRFLMLAGGIDAKRLGAGGFLGKTELKKIPEAGAVIATAPIEIVKKPSMTPMKLKSAIADHPDAVLIIVDYLQLMESDGRHGNRQEAVSEISRAIKTLSGEFNIPIIALSQISREGDDTAPKLKYLRESGSIEQDADTVLFLHPEKGTDKISALLAKGRNCGTGVFELTFNKHTQRILGVEFGGTTHPAPEAERTYFDDDEEPF